MGGGGCVLERSGSEIKDALFPDHRGCSSFERSFVFRNESTPDHPEAPKFFEEAFFTKTGLDFQYILLHGLSVCLLKPVVISPVCLGDL